LTAEGEAFFGLLAESGNRQGSLINDQRKMRKELEILRFLIDCLISCRISCFTCRFDMPVFQSGIRNTVIWQVKKGTLNQ
jgi:hypothetical protein